MGKSFQTMHIILLFIIVLNILDFFELLDPFWDYIKKIVSWFLVGLVFYRLSPSQVLLGEKWRFLDFAFVVAAFALTINDMLRYAELMREFMLANALEYVSVTASSIASGVPSITISITENVSNALQLLGIIPDISAQLPALASELTLSSPITYVAFEYLGAETLYAIEPTSLASTVLLVYNSLIPYAATIEVQGLIWGALVLFAIALLATLRLSVQEKSLVGLVDTGEVHGLSRLLARFVLVSLAYLFFFLFVFSLVMEWLAIAIDAPILMIAILASFVLAHLHRVKFDFTKWEQFVTGFGDVGPLVSLFQSKRTILLGVSGLLVLHILTEILNYLLPFALPLRDHLYLAQLGPGHDNVFTFVSSVPEIAVAVLNLIGWFLLLALPGYIWYKIYKLRGEDHAVHHPRFAPWFLGLFSSALYVVLTSRMIWFRKLEGTGLVGVDFYTQAAAGEPIQQLIVALGIFILVFVLAQFSLRRILYLIPLLATVLFFGIYAYYFFLSSFEHYLLLVVGTFSAAAYFPSFVFLLFLLLTTVFYISGYLLFLYEIVRD